MQVLVALLSVILYKFRLLWAFAVIFVVYLQVFRHNIAVQAAHFNILYFLLPVRYDIEKGVIEVKRWVFNTLIIVFAAVFLVSGGMLIYYFASSRRQQALYDGVAALVQPPVAETPDAPEAPSPYVEVTAPDGSTKSVLRQYEKVYLRNPDLVGWIAIDGTKVNYPVVQTPDKPDYYLKRDFDGKSSRHGCIYAREACRIDPASDNITLYGHHMRDGSMFAALMDYRDKSFFEDHRYIRFDTLQHTQVYEVMAVFLTTASAGEGFDYHMFVDAGSQDEFDDFVATSKSLSLYDTGVGAAWGDKLITLSTCEYSQANGRLVVVAKAIGE